MSERATAASKVVVDTATDPSKRYAAISLAAPALDAAIDGAGLRNKSGKVKVWRVARAAVRPRRTLSLSGQGLAEAAGSQIQELFANSAAHHAQASVHSFTLGDIAAEWMPQDRDSARANWEKGRLLLGQSDADITDRRETALLLCDGLGTCLSDDPVLPDDDLVVATTGDVLALVFANQDPATWDALDSQMIRLSSAIARLTGTQPEQLGGNGELEQLFTEPVDRMRIAMALSRTGWSCDLENWFAVDDFVTSTNPLM